MALVQTADEARLLNGGLGGCVLRHPCRLYVISAIDRYLNPGSWARTASEGGGGSDNERVGLTRCADGGSGFFVRPRQVFVELP